MIGTRRSSVSNAPSIKFRNVKIKTKLKKGSNQHMGCLESDRYKIQVSCSDLTVQHLAEYFAHRGGKGNLGKVLTAETCAKISVAMTGKKHTAESITKLSEAHTGKKHTAETLAKMSEAMTGKKHTAESRAKMSEARTGKKHTAETLAKMSEAQTGKKLTAETRAKISENKKRKGNDGK